MSRRSLRLDDSLLDRSLPLSSASFSVGGAGGRSTRSLRSRRSQQHSVSCSESLLPNTPHKVSGQLFLNSSVHSVSSDVSLLDNLAVQEATLVDSFWGLDEDTDPKESTMLAEQSILLADRTLTGSDRRCPEHPVQMLSRVYCKDCELHADRKESMYTSSSSLLPQRRSEPETSTVYSRDHNRKRRTARSGVCGVMNLRESTATQRERHPNGSLCDDCQEKRHSETHTAASSSSSSSPSVASCLWRLMCSAAVVTASCLCQLTLSAASALWPLTRKLFSASRSAGRSAGRTAGEVFKWLKRQWHHMTTSFPRSRSPLTLVLIVLTLLFLLTLCCFALPSVLPAVNITEWRVAVSDFPGLSSIYSFMSLQSQSAEGAVEESREVQPYMDKLLYSRLPAASQDEEESSAVDELAVDESARLVRLEQSLAALWEHVEGGGQRAEQRHMEVLRLYADLQQQRLVPDQSHTEDTVEAWLSRQLDWRLEHIRTRLDEEQSQQQDLLQQQSQTSRLDQLQLQLQTLAARTEELQRREDSATTVSPSPSTLPATVSGVEHQSHDALLAEVARLETALEDVRRDVEGLAGCRDGCRRLDGVQQTISEQVSAQVREEVRALLYGNQVMAGGRASADAGFPESLLQWLSQQYISGADLQASLASLELSILQNISLQLEQRRSEETVREAVLHAAGAAGAAVTQEDVHTIVKNALRLFSEDRTGMADYALESGGGSILSTRCSETYETKAALLSLFGLSLWYFSQSPRAVIQPDVHPGNCWAFRGSTGFLVIRLSMRIVPTAVSLEHIPKTLAPSGTLHSAPRDFSVYGLDDEGQEGGKLLGTFTYDIDGEALQTYTVTEENEQAFQIIEVRVLSNWGHQEYTCMYRLRVHGTPRDA